MSIALCTLCLNEMEWLPKLYEQHKHWPCMERWIFVESADRVYAETNPELVSSNGLSVDGTSEFLADLASKDGRVTYIPFGFCYHQDPALCKVQARQQYIDSLSRRPTKFFVVLDADEFYCYDDQELINSTLHHTSYGKHMYCFQFTHIWHPLSVSTEPLFKYEVVGGFWDMRHMKAVRWTDGMRYESNHQRPTAGSGWGKVVMYDEPHCFHMAFASEATKRVAKHRYYERRGEAVDMRRRWYVTSRRCFQTWKPGDRLPRGAHVELYQGKIPEVFREDNEVPCELLRTEAAEG